MVKKAITPIRRIWLCASNSTHLAMWSSVARCLRARNGYSFLDLLSLGAYYGPIKAAGRGLGWRCIELPRQGTRKPYWDCNILERTRAALDAKRHIAALMKDRPPALIVLGNDIGIIESLIIAAARSGAAKTLLVQDGILGSQDRERPGIRAWIRRATRAALGLPTGTLYGSGGTDMIAVMGGRGQQWMSARGVDPQRIVITGQPRYDVLVRNEPRGRSGGGAHHKPQGWGGRSRLVGIFSQPMMRYNYERPQRWDVIMRAILTAVTQLGLSYSAVVKLHPAEVRSEFLKRYRTLLKIGRIRLLQHEDSAAVLRAIDLAIVHTSTVGLEAMFLGKPVILYSPDAAQDPYGFIEMRAALAASTPADLLTSIRTAFEDPIISLRLLAGRRKAIAAHAGKLDGRSSERVANLVAAMIGFSGAQKP